MPPSTTSNTTTETAPARPSRLWLWVVVAFAVQIAVWTGWFILASKHPVAEVPLEHSDKH
jgi:hypothetical protein